MAQAKWLKVGAAALLSAGMLAGCSDDTDQAPNVDTEDQPGVDSDEDNSHRITDPDADDSDENETDEEADKDATTDNLEDKEDDIDTND